MANVLYKYMNAIVASYETRNVVAVPPFSRAETATRLGERYLHAWKRADCRTTKWLVTSLGAFFREMRQAGTDHRDAVVSVLVTWAIWRLGGNTIAWAKAVGHIQRWGPEAQARVQALWQRASQNTGMARTLFYSRLQPTMRLLSALGTEKYSSQCSQIMHQVAVLQDVIGSTVAQLTYACLPWEEYCRMLAGVPFFGIGGSPGYCYDGPYRVSPHRQPAFWAKECVLDLLSIEGLFPEAYRPSDRYTFTPMGWGAVAFIATHTGVPDISDDEALAVLQSVHAMRHRFNWDVERLELTDLEWNCCEARKFYRPSATVRRWKIRDRLSDQVPPALLNAPIVVQPAASRPPLPAQAPASAGPGALRPHQMERVLGKTGGWMCVACGRRGQRKDRLSRSGCVGRRETPAQARLRTLGLTPRKLKRLTGRRTTWRRWATCHD